MLKNDFYLIEDVVYKDEYSWNTTICINEKHSFFDGHFPNYPMTPGACLFEIAKELISDKLSQNILINNVKNIKFLDIINPQKTKNVVFEISLQKNDINVFKANIVVCSNNIVFSKINLQFITL